MTIPLDSIITLLKVQMAGCFQELIHGYTTGLVEPCMMRGLQPRDRIALLWKLSFPLKQGSHLRSGKKQPHCAHLIGLPTTVFCDCGRPMGASIKRKRDSEINCRTAICLLSGQCISTDLQIFFFVRRPLPFGGSPLEAYLRTSGESNHHRQSVRAVKNDALPTEPRGHLSTDLQSVSYSSSLQFM